jgi:hypothetical protein
MATIVAYRTANLQTLHFKYVFIQQISVLNILNMLHNLRFSLFKMQFISYANLFGSCIIHIHILNTGCAKI